jgi:hypothetical protein
MRIKLFTLLSLFVAFAMNVGAQEIDHSIKFEETTHDFGIVELNAPTETVFRFKNTSKDTLRLTNVKAGCGCTTPKWTQEVIEPNQTGEISVTYNSSRAGVFNKSVSVNYSDRPEPVILYIKGDVKGDESQIATDVKSAPISTTNYSIPRGALSFEKMIENVKSLSSEEVQSVEFRFKNTSGQDVQFLNNQTEADPGLSVVFKDLVVKPGQETTLKVNLDGKRLKADNTPDGFFSKRVTVVTNEADGKKQLSINGNFTRILTADEKAASPHIEFETTDVNGGKIIEGEKFVYDYKFKNTGFGPLTIESAKASCGCTAAAPPVESIGPGGSSAITATFDSHGRLGIQSKSITVKSNDIENPVITLKFTVEVVKDPFHAGSMMGGTN